jgi:hypothetical protein
MERKKELWLLFQNQGYKTEYIGLRKIEGVVRQVYNPAPTVVGMDSSLILKGLKINGNNAKTIVKGNDWEFIRQQMVLLLLLDGIAWFDVVRNDVELVEGGKETKVFLSPVSVEEMKEIEYDASGNITYAKIEVERNGIKISKEYTSEFEEIIEIDGEKQPPRKTGWDFIPLVEFTGSESDDEPISRIEGLPDPLDQVNEYYSFIRRIGKLHANPKVFGNVRLDTQGIAEKQTERDQSDSMELDVLYSPSERAVLQFLEMQGNVLAQMRNERDELKNQIKEDYPELMLMQLISGGGMSGYAIALKLTGLETVIEKYRNNFKAGLEKTLNMATLMMGQQYDGEITFEKIIPDKVDEVLARISDLYVKGLLDLDTAVKKVVEVLEIDIPPETIVKALKEEETLNQQWESTPEVDPNEAG